MPSLAAPVGAADEQKLKECRGGDGAIGLLFSPLGHLGGGGPGRDLYPTYK